MKEAMTRRERLLWIALVLIGVWGALVLSGAPSFTQADNVASAPAKPDKPPEPSTAELLGIDRVQRRLGTATPTGRGIVVGLVESHSDGGYVPRVQADRFGDVQFAFAVKPAEVSGHATATATVLFGPRGLAPGVQQVVCYPSAHWMGNVFLRPGDGGPPRPGRIRVFTHSWIANSEDPAALATLRRVDYLVDEHDVLVVAGVNNNRTSPMPALLGSAYNVIAVGHWSGNSSGGYTRVETAGRCKPDVVGPGGLTSFSTPAVAAVAARLLEFADTQGPDSPARRAEVIKAILMAGADKPQGWKPAPGKPLDEHLGAGRVRFDRSLEMLEAGQPSGGQITRRCGWQFASLRPGEKAALEFDSPGGLGELSVMLVWHRRIEGRLAQDLATRRMHWLDTPRLANFDLLLHATDDAGATQQVARSAGTIDNVEHLWQRDLPAGRYRIEVVRQPDEIDEAWDYALAWRMER
jgi:hypothetical protein